MSWLLKKQNKGYFIGIIYGAMFKSESELKSMTAYYGRYNPHRGESAALTPYFLQFNPDTDVFIPEEFKSGWIHSVLTELDRARSSSFRKYHQPLVYKAAINLSYRRELLKEAFSDEWVA
ncbi:MAG: hypothetical protein IPJ07_18120 [Acidobacteria bacterium]|nr:hypothetical protein [Acidobacteriota bacterium]